MPALIGALAFVPSLARSQTCFGPAQQVGSVAAPALLECSGVAASRANAGVLWTHNDSPDIKRLFAISPLGTELAQFILPAASQVDWEDIAIGPGPAPAQDYLYVGDIGDNASARASVVVYRVAEPMVDSMITTGTANLAGVEAFTLAYPDGPRDAETLMADPQTGDFYIVQKVVAASAGLYRKPAPHVAGASVLVRVATINPGLAATGGDISPTGDSILIRTYGGAKFWPRPLAGNLWDAFAGPPAQVALISEPQGESIGFADDESGFYTLSEGAAQPIYFYPIIDNCAVDPRVWRSFP